jgi:hypothetical protein
MGPPVIPVAIVPQFGQDDYAAVQAFVGDQEEV